MERTLFIVGAGCSFGESIIHRVIHNFENIVLTEHEVRYKDLQEITQRLKEQYPNKSFETCMLDVTKTEQIKSLTVFFEKEKYFINGFVYCAGTNTILPALSVSEELWDRTFDVNLKGFFFISQVIVAHMISHSIDGRIIAVASQHATVANIHRAPYCASKAGLVHLIKQFALEFSENGICFNSVSPSFILSPATQAILYTPRSKKQYLNKIPLRRYVTPDDVAEAIAFLLTSNSSIITGHDLIVDGGYTIQ